MMNVTKVEIKQDRLVTILVDSLARWISLKWNDDFEKVVGVWLRVVSYQTMRKITQMIGEQNIVIFTNNSI